MPVIVGGTTRTVVVVQSNTVGAVKAGSTAVQVADGDVVSAIVDQSKAVKVASPGTQGQPGPAGAGITPPINFAFGDATPTPVLTAAVKSEVMLVSLQIETPFNGVGAAVKLGTAASPGLLMDTWQNDPSTANTYDVVPRVALAAGTQIVLTITPGAGASQGTGQFVLSIIPSS